MNPNDIFWLARYAHRVLTPLMEPLGGYLKVELMFGGEHPGLEVWTYSNDDPSSWGFPFKLAITNKAQVDQFAESVKAKAGVAA